MIVTMTISLVLPHTTSTTVNITFYTIMWWNMCVSGSINSIIVIIYLHSLIQYPLSILSLLFFICSISITSEQYTCRHVGFDGIRLPCNLLEICLQLTAWFLNKILKCELQKEPHRNHTRHNKPFFLGQRVAGQRRGNHLWDSFM